MSLLPEVVEIVDPFPCQFAFYPPKMSISGIRFHSIKSVFCIGNCPFVTIKMIKMMMKITVIKQFNFAFPHLNLSLDNYKDKDPFRRAKDP